MCRRFTLSNLPRDQPKPLGPHFALIARTIRVGEVLLCRPWATSLLIGSGCSSLGLSLGDDSHMTKGLRPEEQSYIRDPTTSWYGNIRGHPRLMGYIAQTIGMCAADKFIMPRQSLPEGFHSGSFATNRWEHFIYIAKRELSLSHAHESKD